MKADSLFLTKYKYFESKKGTEVADGDSRSMKH
jgi:hypothetical protein